MYLYRALNDMDIKFSPIDNGLVSKKIINEVMNSKYKLEFNDDSYEYYLSYRISNLKKHIEEIKEAGKKESLKGLEELYKHNINYVTRGIIRHLTIGSNDDSRWISFSNEIEACFRYYLEQENKHYIAVVFASDELPSPFVDLSSVKNQNDVINFLYTSSGTLAEANSRSLAYALKSKEVIIYSYIPSNYIKAVLGAFDVDLLINNCFSLDNYSKEKLLSIRDTLEKKIVLDECLDYYDIFKSLYIDNNTVKNTINKNYKYEDLVNIKRYFLRLLSDIDVDIDKEKIKEKVILPEDYKNS